MHAMCLELLQDHAVPGYTSTPPSVAFTYVQLTHDTRHTTHRAKVLDVGSGSGYLSACLGHMVGDKGKVIGIDRQCPHHRRLHHLSLSLSS
jgi:protein-L-isoaspartate(D-aspartate) O-methyltransferase